MPLRYVSAGRFANVNTTVGVDLTSARRTKVYKNYAKCNNCSGEIRLRNAVQGRAARVCDQTNEIYFVGSNDCVTFNRIKMTRGVCFNYPRQRLEFTPNDSSCNICLCCAN